MDRSGGRKPVKRLQHLPFQFGIFSGHAHDTPTHPRFQLQRCFSPVRNNPLLQVGRGWFRWSAQPRHAIRGSFLDRTSGGFFWHGVQRSDY